MDTRQPNLEACLMVARLRPEKGPRCKTGGTLLSSTKPLMVGLHNEKSTPGWSPWEQPNRVKFTNQRLVRESNGKLLTG